MVVYVSVKSGEDSYERKLWSLIAQVTCVLSIEYKRLERTHFFFTISSSIGGKCALDERFDMAARFTTTFLLTLTLSLAHGFNAPSLMQGAPTRKSLALARHPGARGLALRPRGGLLSLQAIADGDATVIGSAGVVASCGTICSHIVFKLSRWEGATLLLLPVQFSLLAADKLLFKQSCCTPSIPSRQLVAAFLPV